MEFKESDVYELIDGILVDGIDFEEHADEAPYAECRYCFQSIKLTYKGGRLESDDVKKLLPHKPKCPYPLAESMNTGRDYKMFPLNGDYE